jgi:hypothetical protein
MKPKGKPVEWSPETAYVVGLITTDGNLSSDGRHLDITSNDFQLLETAKKCLGIKNRITPKFSGSTGWKSSYRIQFGNVIFYKWLLGIGLMPNKSKIIGSIKIPDKYFFHFLRGCLDGDGNILRYMDKIFPKSERLYLRFYCASIKHSEWLQKNIKKLAKINGRIKKDTRVYTLVYAKKESLKLLPLIYSNKNVPCLTRKYKLIKSFI